LLVEQGIDVGRGLFESEVLRLVRCIVVGAIKGLEGPVISVLVGDFKNAASLLGADCGSRIGGWGRAGVEGAVGDPFFQRADLFRREGRS
jgi:hypothetical protein